MFESVQVPKRKFSNLTPLFNSIQESQQITRWTKAHNIRILSEFICIYTYMINHLNDTKQIIQYVYMCVSIYTGAS